MEEDTFLHCPKFSFSEQSINATQQLDMMKEEQAKLEVKGGIHINGTETGILTAYLVPNPKVRK